MNIQVDMLHNKLLEMMKRFHIFCEENQIPYYIIAGTALGATRHKGFIPWDDDVDIAIPRPEYERMQGLSHKLPQGLEFMFYKNTNNSPCHYIKLIDSNTTLIERFYLNLVEGLYIDIFPLDGSFSSGYLEKLRHKKIWVLYRQIIWHCNTEKKIGIINKIYKWYCSSLNLGKLHKKLEELLLAVKYDEGDCVGNFLGGYMEKDFYPVDYFGTPTLYCFEDSQFYGPEKIQEYLTALYGDYMQLPPPEQRVLRHNFHYLNFDLPYKEYIRLNQYNQEK